MIGKLIYLIVIRPDIIFAMGVLSRYMQSPFQLHRTAACRILHILKGLQVKVYIIVLPLIWILWDILMLIWLVILLIVVLLLIIAFLLESIY